MKKVVYNKLIRDRVPGNIARSGGTYKVRTLKGKEFERELIKKVGEEAGGLMSTKNKSELVSELADVIAVIDEIKKLKRISEKELRAALTANFSKKGGFKKKIFLLWTSDTGYRTNERTYRKQ